MTALSPAQPYPGLRPYDRGDEDYFFGRGDQIRRLRQKLTASRLVAVVGRSGCGKSSLVRAGLVPLLTGERIGPDEAAWRIAMLRPQGRSIQELAAALLRVKSEADEPAPQPESPLRQSRMEAILRRSSMGLVEAASEPGASGSGNLLIVVDQFEEIFRFEGAQGSEADEATAFVRLLLAAATSRQPRVHILLTMRLDFLGDCARFQGLSEAISDGQFLVPNLSRAERRAAIEEPARKCNRTVSAAVTQRLLNEIGDDPDQLPVLQHVLMRMWQQANDGGEISLVHYDATGGVQNAISRHANEVYDALPNDAHRTVAERMFKAISELDRRGRAIRRSPPLTLGEIVPIAGGDEASVRRVVEDFRAPQCCFLMPPAAEPLTDSTPVDISHESLLRRWEKMLGKPPSHEGWLLEEDRDGKTYSGLVEAAQTFASDKSAVLPPAQARQRRAWWTRVAPNPAWAERYGNKFDLVKAFLDASTKREAWRRYAAAALIFVGASTAAGFVVGGSMYLGEQRKTQEAEAAREAAEAALQKLAKEKIESDKKLAAQQLAGEETRQQDVVTLKQQNERLRKELEQARSGGYPPDPKPDDAKPDETSDAVVPTASVNQEGVIWIGPVRNSNLQTVDGNVSVSPLTVQRGSRYEVVWNTNLRQDFPDEATYAQKPSVAVLAAGTQIEAKDSPKPYRRGTTEQYWLPVRVIASSLPTVYFQFATSPRVQAQAVSQQLQGMGYRVPGEERLDSAQSKREVRYFYPQDEPAAQKLVDAVTEILKKLGYPPNPAVAINDLTGFQGKKNAPGTLELWLDLPARAVAK